MKPLICPQCGGKITEYSPWQNFATCGYCATRFVIEREKNPTTQIEPEFESAKTSNFTPNIFVIVLVSAFVIIGGVILLAVLTNKSKTNPPSYVAQKNYPTPTPRVSPTETPNPNLLQFGGKGTANGLFQDAAEIAVDSKGRIYVADETLRVQQFDEKGGFLKVWQIPSQTNRYRRARTIQKIAVDDRDRLYVLVGGTILIYANDATEPTGTLHVAPDFMQDFALRSEGGLLVISNNGEIETLLFINKSGKITRRLNGFHTETADAALSPFETGLAAIRLAVDGAGNIFSVYAFGDLGSYSLSYNTEELMVFRFTPEGKYVNKFVESMNSCGIAVDNQSRIYVSGKDLINVYSNTGEQVATVPNVGSIESFTLDKQNNIYFVGDNLVFKRPATQ
jgi:hypothetical protein